MSHLFDPNGRPRGAGGWLAGMAAVTIPVWAPAVLELLAAAIGHPLRP